MPSTPATNACTSPNSELRRMFDKADANKDGALDEGEFNNYMKTSVHRGIGGGAGSVFSDLFDQVDSNDDGMIDFDEFSKMARTTAHLVDDIAGGQCSDSGPAQTNGLATPDAVTNDSGSQDRSGSQGGSQDDCGCHEDPVAALGNALSETGLEPEDALRMMIDQGLVDVDCEGTPTPNGKTAQFLSQLETLRSGSTQGINEVLGKRIEWLVDDGATWEGATTFMFDQGALKADSKGNIVFNYPKGLTLNHYLNQFMDPKFRQAEQCGSESLDLGLGSIYDRNTAAGQDPIDTLHWMLDSGLAQVSDRGVVTPTDKATTYNAQLDGLVSGNHEGVAPNLCRAFDEVVSSGGHANDFMKFIFDKGMMGMNEQGQPILNDKGLAFNHDLIQLVDQDFRAAHGRQAGAVDVEVAQIYDELRARGLDALGALNHMIQGEYARLTPQGSIEQTGKTDIVADALQDFNAIA